MALIVFLRGVNVGGHRTFRPSVLAKKLKRYEVVNVGAAGTFVVHKPGPRTKFIKELQRNLPFETTVVICADRDLIGLEAKNPFKTQAKGPKIVHFVSISSKGSVKIPPTTLPPKGPWFVKVIGSRNQFAFGIYRRHMKTITYLSQVDKLFGETATTRNWNTITTILRILKTKRSL
jgi:uncharacterized protein (DUF1697 family)